MLFSFLNQSEPALTLGFEALTAVDGTISAGLEGHLGFTAAAVTDDGEHLPGSTAVAVLGLTGVTAGLAPAGFVLETLFGVEFLLTSGENKFLTAVTAHQRLVLIHSFA